MLNDPLANALNTIVNAERVGKTSVTVSPSSGFVEKVLTILNKQGYIGSFEKTEGVRGVTLTVHLLGKVNQCGAIKPRFAFPAQAIERYEKRYLPAKSFGKLIISTSQGLLTNDEVRKKNIGGRVIAYCY